MKERFGVDEAICSGDHACIRLSGCPSLSLKLTDDPLKDDPVAAIDNACVGCGNCGEVAEAAVLCPSFYRTEIIFNPSRWDRRLAVYASASSVGCSGAAKPVGSPLRETVSFAAALPLLPRGEGGGRGPTDEGAAPRNPHPQPLSRWRGGLAGCSAAAKPAGSPLPKTVDSASAALPLLPQGEGGGRSPTDEGAAATSPPTQTLSRWRGEPRR